VIEMLRERHGLLAAYLKAAGSIDRRDLHKPVSIDKLVPVVSSREEYGISLTGLRWPFLWPSTSFLFAPVA